MDKDIFSSVNFFRRETVYLNDSSVIRNSKEYVITVVSVTRWLLKSIYNHEKLPNCIQNLPKSVAIFAKYWISPQKIAKDILVYAKVAKFRQIWSHWLIIAYVSY